MLQAFAVGLGAACGALARYGVTAALGGSALGPLGVLLLINALGSFLMGRFRPPAVLGTGFLGGFSTFSTAINEMVTLFRKHRYPTAAAYLVLSLGVPVVAAACGFLV